MMWLGQHIDVCHMRTLQNEILALGCDKNNDLTRMSNEDGKEPQQGKTHCQYLASLILHRQQLF